MTTVVPISGLDASPCGWCSVFSHGGATIILAGLGLWVLAAVWPGSARGGDGVREPILAGSWYPGSPASLAESVESQLRGEGRPEIPPPEGRSRARSLAAAGRFPRALIVPHAGHIYSGACAGETFSLLRGSSFRRVILLGPSHRVGLSGAALPAESAFATPLGSIPLDAEAMRALQARPSIEVIPRAHAQEHSLEIELPFLQKVLEPGFRLVPLVVGRLDDRDLADLAEAVGAIWDEETILVVSSDFTHYGAAFDFLPFSDRVPESLRALDLGAVERIRNDDREGFEAYRAETGATICGAEPIRVLLKAAEGRNLQGLLVDYYTSGDLTGDWDHAVSYAGIAFFPASEGPADPARGPAAAAPEPSRETSDRKAVPSRPRPLDADEQSFLLQLARKAVRAVVEGEPPPAPDLPPETAADSPLREPRGVFVTLTRGEHHRLRGCIGNILGDEALVLGVIENAQASATRDPRFHPVEPSELQDLHIEISVLTAPLPVPGWQEIRVGTDGVVLEKNGRRAVFLPQVAPEMGWDVPEMLRHLSLKAGLGPEDWRHGARFYTFQAQVFEEDSSRDR